MDIVILPQKQKSEIEEVQLSTKKAGTRDSPIKIGDEKQQQDMALSQDTAASAQTDQSITTSTSKTVSPHKVESQEKGTEKSNDVTEGGETNAAVEVISVAVEEDMMEQEKEGATEIEQEVISQDGALGHMDEFIVMDSGGGQYVRPPKRVTLDEYKRRKVTDSTSFELPQPTTSKREAVTHAKLHSRATHSEKTATLKASAQGEAEAGGIQRRSPLSPLSPLSEAISEAMKAEVLGSKGQIRLEKRDIEVEKDLVVKSKEDLSAVEKASRRLSPILPPLALKKLDVHVASEQQSKSETTTQASKIPVSSRPTSQQSHRFSSPISTPLPPHPTSFPILTPHPAAPSHTALPPPPAAPSAAAAAASWSYGSYSHLFYSQASGIGAGLTQAQDPWPFGHQFFPSGTAGTQSASPLDFQASLRSLGFDDIPPPPPVLRSPDHHMTPQSRSISRSRSRSHSRSRSRSRTRSRSRSHTRTRSRSRSRSVSLSPRSVSRSRSRSRSPLMRTRSRRSRSRSRSNKSPRRSRGRGVSRSRTPSTPDRLTTAVMQQLSEQISAHLLQTIQVQDDKQKKELGVQASPSTSSLGAQIGSGFKLRSISSQTHRPARHVSRGIQCSSRTRGMGIQTDTPNCRATHTQTHFKMRNVGCQTGSIDGSGLSSNIFDALLQDSDQDFSEFTEILENAKRKFADAIGLTLDDLSDDESFFDVSSSPGGTSSVDVHEEGEPEEDDKAEGGEGDKDANSSQHMAPSPVISGASNISDGEWSDLEGSLNNSNSRKPSESATPTHHVSTDDAIQLQHVTDALLSPTKPTSVDTDKDQQSTKSRSLSPVPPPPPKCSTPPLTTSAYSVVCGPCESPPFSSPLSMVISPIGVSDIDDILIEEQKINETQAPKEPTENVEGCSTASKSPVSVAESGKQGKVRSEDAGSLKETALSEDACSSNKISLSEDAGSLKKTSLSEDSGSSKKASLPVDACSSSRMSLSEDTGSSKKTADHSSVQEHSQQHSSTPLDMFGPSLPPDLPQTTAYGPALPPSTSPESQNQSALVASAAATADTPAPVYGPPLPPPRASYDVPLPPTYGPTLPPSMDHRDNSRSPQKATDSAGEMQADSNCGSLEIQDHREAVKDNNEAMTDSQDVWHVRSISLPPFKMSDGSTPSSNSNSNSGQSTPLISNKSTPLSSPGDDGSKSSEQLEKHDPKSVSQQSMSRTTSSDLTEKSKHDSAMSAKPASDGRKRQMSSGRDSNEQAFKSPRKRRRSRKRRSPEERRLKEQESPKEKRIKKGSSSDDSSDGGSSGNSAAAPEPKPKTRPETLTTKKLQEALDSSSLMESVRKAASSSPPSSNSKKFGSDPVLLPVKKKPTLTAQELLEKVRAKKLKSPEEGFKPQLGREGEQGSPASTPQSPGCSTGQGSILLSPPFASESARTCRSDSTINIQELMMNFRQHMAAKKKLSQDSSWVHHGAPMQPVSPFVGPHPPPPPPPPDAPPPSLVHPQPPLPPSVPMDTGTEIALPNFSSMSSSGDKSTSQVTQEPSQPMASSPVDPSKTAAAGEGDSEDDIDAQLEAVMDSHITKMRSKSHSPSKTSQKSSTTSTKAKELRSSEASSSKQPKPPDLGQSTSESKPSSLSPSLVALLSSSKHFLAFELVQHSPSSKESGTVEPAMTTEETTLSHFPSTNKNSADREAIKDSLDKGTKVCSDEGSKDCRKAESEQHPDPGAVSEQLKEQLASLSFEKQTRLNPILKLKSTDAKSMIAATPNRPMSIMYQSSVLDPISPTGLSDDSPVESNIGKTMTVTKFRVKQDDTPKHVTSESHVSESASATKMSEVSDVVPLEVSMSSETEKNVDIGVDDGRDKASSVSRHVSTGDDNSSDCSQSNTLVHESGDAISVWNKHSKKQCQEEVEVDSDSQALVCHTDKSENVPTEQFPAKQGVPPDTSSNQHCNADTEGVDRNDSDLVAISIHSMQLTVSKPSKGSQVEAGTIPGTDYQEIEQAPLSKESVQESSKECQQSKELPVREQQEQELKQKVAAQLEISPEINQEQVEDAQKRESQSVNEKRTKDNGSQSANKQEESNRDLHPAPEEDLGGQGSRDPSPEAFRGEGNEEAPEVMDTSREDFVVSRSPSFSPSKHPTCISSSTHSQITAAIEEVVSTVLTVDRDMHSLSLIGTEASNLELSDIQEDDTDTEVFLHVKDGSPVEQSFSGASRHSSSTSDPFADSTDSSPLHISSRSPERHLPDSVEVHVKDGSPVDQSFSSASRHSSSTSDPFADSTDSSPLRISSRSPERQLPDSVQVHVKDSLPDEKSFSGASRHSSSTSDPFADSADSSPLLHVSPSVSSESPERQLPCSVEVHVAPEMVKDTISVNTESINCQSTSTCSSPPAQSPGLLSISSLESQMSHPVKVTTSESVDSAESLLVSIARGTVSQTNPVSTLDEVDTRSVSKDTDSLEEARVREEESKDGNNHSGEILTSDSPSSPLNELQSMHTTNVTEGLTSPEPHQTESITASELKKKATEVAIQENNSVARKQEERLCAGRNKEASVSSLPFTQPSPLGADNASLSTAAMTPTTETTPTELKVTFALKDFVEPEPPPTQQSASTSGTEPDAPPTIQATPTTTVSLALSTTNDTPTCMTVSQAPPTCTGSVHPTPTPITTSSSSSSDSLLFSTPVSTPDVPTSSTARSSAKSAASSLPVVLTGIPTLSTNISPSYRTKSGRPKTRIVPPRSCNAKKGSPGDDPALITVAPVSLTAGAGANSNHPIQVSPQRLLPSQSHNPVPTVTAETLVNLLHMLCKGVPGQPLYLTIPSAQKPSTSGSIGKSTDSANSTANMPQISTPSGNVKLMPSTPLVSTASSAKTGSVPSNTSIGGSQQPTCIHVADEEASTSVQPLLDSEKDIPLEQLPTVEIGPLVATAPSLLHDDEEIEIVIEDNKEYYGEKEESLCASDKDEDSPEIITSSEQSVSELGLSCPYTEVETTVHSTTDERLCHGTESSKMVEVDSHPSRQDSEQDASLANTEPKLCDEMELNEEVETIDPTDSALSVSPEDKNDTVCTRIEMHRDHGNLPDTVESSDLPEHTDCCVLPDKTEGSSRQTQCGLPDEIEGSSIKSPTFSEPIQATCKVASPIVTPIPTDVHVTGVPSISEREAADIGKEDTPLPAESSILAAREGEEEGERESEVVEVPPIPRSPSEQEEKPEDVDERGSAQVTPEASGELLSNINCCSNSERASPMRIIRDQDAYSPLPVVSEMPASLVDNPQLSCTNSENKDIHVDTCTSPSGTAQTVGEGDTIDEDGDSQASLMEQPSQVSSSSCEGKKKSRIGSRSPLFISLPARYSSRDKRVIKGPSERFRNHTKRGHKQLVVSLPLTLYWRRCQELNSSKMSKSVVESSPLLFTPITPMMSRKCLKRGISGPCVDDDPNKPNEKEKETSMSPPTALVVSYPLTSLTLSSATLAVKRSETDSTNCSALAKTSIAVVEISGDECSNQVLSCNGRGKNEEEDTQLALRLHPALLGSPVKSLHNQLLSSPERLSTRRRIQIGGNPLERGRALNSKRSLDFVVEKLSSGKKTATTPGVIEVSDYSPMPATCVDFLSTEDYTCESETATSPHVVVVSSPQPCEENGLAMGGASETLSTKESVSKPEAPDIPVRKSARLQRGSKAASNGI